MPLQLSSAAITERNFPLPTSIKKTFTWGAHTVTLETGEVARQAGEIGRAHV
jgi:hypothetical protein